MVDDGCVEETDERLEGILKACNVDGAAMTATAIIVTKARKSIRKIIVAVVRYVNGWLFKRTIVDYYLFVWITFFVREKKANGTIKTNEDVMTVNGRPILTNQKLLREKGVKNKNNKYYYYGKSKTMFT